MHLLTRFVHFQVPAPRDAVLPWERMLDDGTIVSNVSEEDEGEGILGLVFGTIARLVVKAASAVGKKFGLA